MSIVLQAAVADTTNRRCETSSHKPYTRPLKTPIYNRHWHPLSLCHSLTLFLSSSVSVSLLTHINEPWGWFASQSAPEAQDRLHDAPQLGRLERAGLLQPIDGYQLGDYFAAGVRH